jgi:hypothetical protein
MAIAKGYKALLGPSLSLRLGSRFRLSVVGARAAY